MKTRRGSALLIVLGMMAFMVISAVAFSAYMRYSRLPSSFLRQTVSSRLLVKAALSEAIDEIDAAIGNNPHPGVGNHSYDYPRQSTQTQFARNLNRNKWIGRVYIGATNTSQSALSPSQCLIDPNETVSPLCLEALAHIPTPLVNEVRYYSRRSTAGKWHPMPYDAGRYSFCAVDVSDYFDVNALAADRPRSSFAPDRLSLAYLWEDWGESGNDGLVKLPGTPANWDSFMDTFIGDGKLPLVSVADLNLAINYAKPGGLESPFGTYARNDGDNFYGIGDQNSAKANQYRRMTFVTDGWFPPTNVVGQTGDLDAGTSQLFLDMPTSGSLNYRTAAQVVAGSSPTRAMMLANGMNHLDMVCLWDYLDPDHIPVSLAMPTVEQNPMFVGMQPSFEFTITPKAIANVSAAGPWGSDPDDPTNPNRRARQVPFEYRFEILAGTCVAPSLWMYPFVRNARASGSWTAEYVANFGFACDGANCRINSRSGGFVVGKSGFSTSPAFPKFGASGPGTLRLTPQRTFSLFPNSNQIVDEQSALESVNDVNFGTVAAAMAAWSTGPDGVLFTVPHLEQQKQDPLNGIPWGDVEPDQSKWPIDTSVSPAFTQNAGFYPLQSDLITQLPLGTPSPSEIVPYLSLTIRVKRDNDVVDLVPAATTDDAEYNNINQTLLVPERNNYPLMLLPDVNKNKITFSEAGFWAAKDTPMVVKFAPSASHKSLFCPDPRWNFAPENFLLSADTLDSIKSCYTGSDKSKVLLGVEGRDTDMFMAVSDQGWLQSPSELAFLPRTDPAIFGDGKTSGNPSGLVQSYLSLRLGKGFASSVNDLAHGSLMWRTYRLYAQEGQDRDMLYNLGLCSSASNFKISPFSTCTNVFMAAFANTPYSWWAAGIGNPNCANVEAVNLKTADAFNQKYAFCEQNNNKENAFARGDLLRVAGSIMDAMRADGDNWQNAYDDMDWAGLNSDLCGIDLEDSDDKFHLYEIDRKTLFGFWRECFDVRQQLFLIFVRAEPMMMGGGSSTQTPPQLGAKAVALVWRDPAPTAQNNAPHKTRILFYRQFD